MPAATASPLWTARPSSPRPAVQREVRERIDAMDRRDFLAPDRRPYPVEPAPKPGEVIYDGCTDYLVIGDGTTCIPINYPGLLFSIPPPGHYLIIGMMTKGLRSPRRVIDRLTKHLCSMLPRIIPERIENNMGQRLVIMSIISELKEFAERIR